MKKIIDAYKNRKKRAIIQSVYKGNYAFVGIGAHSLNNLYPILDYHKINLKYIVTRSKENADFVSQCYKNTEGTNDLNKVLADDSIQGIFVCASPHQHFQLAQSILEAKKNLFIEKPPCASSSELEQLILLQNKHNATALVGLQKRYAPAYDTLKSKLSGTSSYTLKYQTGAYPEGDVMLDLFIHPLDLAVYLFGAAQAVSIQKIHGRKSSFTYFLHLKHDNGAFGSLELSTDYSWTNACEQLIVNTNKGVFQSLDTASLNFTNKPKIVAGIPLEKVMSFQPKTTQIIQQNNFLPVKNHNQLHTSGFFGEIETFLKLCEGKKAKNKSSLQSLEPTYKLIETLIP
jgi:virulence factor